MKLIQFILNLNFIEFNFFIKFFNLIKKYLIKIHFIYFLSVCIFFYFFYCRLPGGKSAWKSQQYSIYRTDIDISFKCTQPFLYFPDFPVIFPKFQLYISLMQFFIAWVGQVYAL